MLTAKKIYEQINKLTIELIETGLCDAQNFPSLNKGNGNIEEIGISNIDNSIFLRSIPYAEMFVRLNEGKMYNVKMIDGALISMQYRFKDNQLIAHRLSFLPSPNLEAFQNEPDVYIDDEIYAEVIDKRIVTVPVRFDFDNNESVYEPVIHPISHLTLGQYENCRIPVETGITPYQFLSFIITNFYHTAHIKYNSKFSVFKDCFETTIFEVERELIHLNIPVYRS